MSLRVLVSAPYILPAFDRYRPALERAGIEPVLVEVVERLSKAELIRHAGRVDGVVCGDDPFSAEVLQAFAPRLKVISKWGTGLDSIDGQAAERLGVVVRNTPDAFTDAVADSVLGYVLAFARGGPWMDRDMKAGGWRKRTALALRESTLGVVGVGRIGKAVLRRAHPFGMRLLGNDIVPIEDDVARGLGVEMLPLEDLARQSDFVSLNCDLNPTSRHLMDARFLSLMKATAVVVNTARGAVIDEPALIQALRDGTVAGAALDVFEEEPLPANSPLRRMDNVLLAPHNANSSHEAWQRVHHSTLRNLFEGLGLEVPAEWKATSDGRASPAERKGEGL